eukprot:TRINITY_DN3490_c0_g1_i1.p1 TRINITY_DN3490_c0_g1~~TRINITY_DN3490_c0_g1_i1.p1  ORF type:complete len:204 (+),score=66.60 TRINITY_DN3490_c0_g1_i1:507-1118(+)
MATVSADGAKAGVRRTRSVVICAPVTGNRLWLTQDDEDVYMDERSPPVIKFDGRAEAEGTFGFVLAYCKYTLVVYISVAEDVGAADIAPVEMGQPDVMQLDVLGVTFHTDAASGARYMRVEFAFHATTEGVKRLPVALSLQNAPRSLSLQLHANVLKEKQGHPALAPGVRCTMRIHNCDTDVESNWGGFRDIESGEDNGDGGR